jgi:hypothetical protein
MEREQLESLLAKEADGELAPEEADALERVVASDADAAQLASSWRRTNKSIEHFASELGSPSPEARERVLAGARAAEPVAVLPGTPNALTFPAAPARDWRVVLAAAAGIVLALGTGFGVGAAVYADPRPASTPDAVVDIRTLRDALRETRTLMPERVRWTALCAGRLSLGTSPVPVRGGASGFHFATFTVHRSDRPTPMVCQIAVLDGEEAVVEWESDGWWSISCLPVTEGPDVALSTRISFRPAGSERGVALAAEPTISGGGPVPLVSSRIGGVEFEVSVSVTRALGSDAEGRTSL